MLEPQGTLFFLLLMVAFGGLLVFLVVTKQVVFRVLAACLAFLPAMVFGIAAVNKYYDYYQTWGTLFSDLSGQSAQSAQQVAAAGLGQGNANSINAFLRTTNAVDDAQVGVLFQTHITGPRSHITRDVYVWLPPQYFSKKWANYRFPVIELLHGAPGQPESWINVMNVTSIFLQLLAENKASPAVLIMPDTDGGQQYSLQCLNNPYGLQDMTYVAVEVPSWVSTHLDRVQRPGLMWGIGGYSEGGFCAANIALQFANRFGYAGVLSGYFAPITSQVPIGGKATGKPHDINVFAHYPALGARNTPMKYILRIPIGVPVPQFFLAAGAQDQGDVQDAESFQQLLQARVANVPLDIVPNGGHQATVWRAALSPMLEWMTAQLAMQVQHFTQTQIADAHAAAKGAGARSNARDRVKAGKTSSVTRHPLLR